MKTVTLVSAALALLVAGSAHAGHRDHPHGPFEPDFEKHVQRMAEELDLSAEQSDQLQAVFEASITEHEALRARIQEQFGPEMCALRQATDEQVREILTSEQQAELDERKERLAEFAEGRGPRGHKGPMGAFLAECEPEE
jgi:Spy/CpxP family protein refolding chaperone